MAVASQNRLMLTPESIFSTKKKWYRNDFRSETTSLSGWLGLQIPQISINQSSVGCAGQTRPIHGGPSWQVKRSAANILVPDPTAHLQRSSGVHASTGQGCFGSKRGTDTIFGRWSQWWLACLLLSSMRAQLLPICDMPALPSRVCTAPLFHLLCWKSSTQKFLTAVVVFACFCSLCSDWGMYSVLGALTNPKLTLSWEDVLHRTRQHQFSYIYRSLWKQREIYIFRQTNDQMNFCHF